MFSLRSPLYAFVILCETVWKCGFRTARENYGKTLMKRSYTLAFPSNGKTIDEHVFMAFTVSNSVGKRLENAAFARSGKLLKISYLLSFSWCWITCDERRAFLEFTKGEQ